MDQYTTEQLERELCQAITATQTARDTWEALSADGTRYTWGRNAEIYAALQEYKAASTRERDLALALEAALRPTLEG